jgi:hypothetical protein
MVKTRVDQWPGKSSQSVQAMAVGNALQGSRGVYTVWVLYLWLCIMQRLVYISSAESTATMTTMRSHPQLPLQCKLEHLNVCMTDQLRFSQTL